MRGNYIPEMPKPKTTTFVLHSFTYLAIKEWNSLPNFIRLSNFTDLKKHTSKAQYVFVITRFLFNSVTCVVPHLTFLSGLSE